MSYRGRRRAGRVPVEAYIEGMPAGRRPSPWARLRAWVAGWRAGRLAARVAAAQAAGTRPPGYDGRHTPVRPVLAVEIRLDRARRSDVRRPVSVSVARASREKAPARHSCPGTARRSHGTAHRRRLDADSTMSVADVLDAIERGTGYVAA